jgi:hypothetical protein
MKKLFMAVLIPVLFVLGTPALLATIMYDGSGDTALPIELYTEDADAKQMVMEELTASLDDVSNEVEDDFIFNLHEDIINVAIFEAIREENPNYMPTDDCATPEACYVAYEQIPVEDFNIMLRVVGAWVDFEDDMFSLNTFLEVELEDGFTYKTVISVDFKFLDTTEYYLLEFEQINVGNLPIPSGMIASVLSAIENNVDDVDLQATLDEMEYGEADLDEFSFKLYKDEIVDMIGNEEQTDENGEPVEEDSGQKMMKQVLSEIFEQSLVVFEFTGDELVASARLSMFKSEDITDIPEYLYDLHSTDPVTGEVGPYDPNALDSETYLKDLFTEYVFNYALVGGGFEINEETFNKLIYSSQNGFEDMMQVEELELADETTRTLEYGLKGLWFEMDPSGIQAKALIQLDSISSVLTLKATKVEEASSDTELVFEFTEITFGEDADEAITDYVSISDLEVFKEMLADLGDVEFGEFDEFGTLTISAERLSALMQDGSEEGTVNVTGISLVQDAIVIDIEPADAELAAALEDFGNAVESVVANPQLLTDLENVLDTTTEGPEQEVYNAVTDLQETLLNNETPDSEQVEELFDNFSEMDEESQEAFLSTFETIISEDDPDLFAEFEALFGEVTQDQE